MSFGGARNLHITAWEGTLRCEHDKGQTTTHVAHPPARWERTRGPRKWERDAPLVYSSPSTHLNCL